MSPTIQVSAVLPSAQELAVRRTVLALDRTQMAWIRTGLSMLTFGFSVIKFFQFLRQEAINKHADESPRQLGLAIMAVGLFALGMATWSYVRSRRELGARARLLDSPTLLVTGALLAIQGLALSWALTGR
jgi:putative membrane protein